MRAILHIVVAVSVVGATLAGHPDGVDTTAVSRPLEWDIRSIAPAPDKAVGIAHPVVVTFNGPIADRPAAERSLSITSTPAMTGKYEWLDSNVVQWIPDRFWPSHSTVKLMVGGRPAEISTGPALIGIASISRHTFTVSYEGVWRRPSDGISGLPAPHHLPRLGEEGVFPASMGRPEYPTPIGTYAVLGKERSVLMDSSSVGIPVTAADGYKIDVEYAVRFTSRGLFVHAAPWAVPAMGYENVSHGCISLSPAAAEWYFDNVNVGDPVVVQE
ncbi:L,D-transpeptidase [Mycobacteroides chelonae]|jgi:lipoprotein-anchoring transpeptidase ErfK/SrfK|nr:L,D-transpeptidase [Mycobacteroides chelonae]MBF9318152.1 L,D-transpeptidase [Mycobacteroides chelonae]MBF9329817.1 L,D-transpeptidase [Mycobacteroides chelonae]MBF9351880.1 L,D-transpeptidase [Mycobacteroides chelonae]MBF9423716.1 L,D-transpeptidase [Mycobacteroides chelonae]MBF9437319.1 L,D-transpeptidase [Mycobacteroides chelonae]